VWRRGKRRRGAGVGEPHRGEQGGVRARMGNGYSTRLSGAGGNLRTAVPGRARGRQRKRERERRERAGEAGRWADP
jgi:hypothetical protein